MVVVTTTDVQNYSYRWKQVIEFGRGMTRNVPWDRVAVFQCQAISAEVWDFAPWNETVTALADGEIMLNPGDQQFGTPSDINRIRSGQIHRLTPNDTYYDPLDVVDSQPLTHIHVHPCAIRAISWEKAQGLLRLDSIPDFDSSETFEIQGNYQRRHVTVKSLDDPCWFSDEFLHLILEGMLWWGYKLADRPSSAATQYKVFRAKLQEKWDQQKAGMNEQMAPLEGSIGSDGGSGFGFF